MSDTTPPFALYNPAMLPPEVLLAEFTARLPLLAILLDIIRANDPGQPPQHVLIVGPRGMGKTTLLCAIAGSIALREPELKNQWQPVVFDEESRRIGDLADFWLECIRQWESATEPNLTRSHRLDTLLAKPGPDIEDQAREVFLSLVDASGKRALLLIDNLNDLFAAIHEPEALMRLRSFLMADSRVMIIGAATRWFSDVTGLDKPFFEFFRPFELHALDLQEMRECLAGVAEVRGDQRVLDTLKDRPGSIEVLHILTGGNPRLIRTFYRLLNEGMNGELRLQLERLIDDYTPYHKAIIDALPGQQQRVLDAIALHWNPCDVAHVARTTRLPSNQVSAQIKALIKAGLISEVEAIGTSKKKAYMLTDRFSNIHYLMRHGRTGRKKMHWFVMTLRALFDDKEFAEAAAKAVRQSACDSSASNDESLFLAHNALQCAGSEDARRMFLDRMVGSKEFDGDVDVILAEKICRQTLEDNPADAYAHFKWGRLLDVHLKRFPDAEAAYRKAIELDPKFASPWNNLANLLTAEFNRHEEAEAAYRKAIELDPKFAFPWNNLGILLTDELNRHEEAEAAYRKAIELDPKFALQWNNLGNLLTNKLNRHEEAEAAYRKAIDLDPSNPYSWHNLAFLCAERFGLHAEAETAYLKAIELDSNNGRLWSNYGLLLSKTKRSAEARAAYHKAIQLDPLDQMAWNNHGTALNGIGRHSEAEEAYRKAIELSPNWATVWNNLGIELADHLNRKSEAENAFKKSIELDPLYASPWNNLAGLLYTSGKYDEAEEANRNAIRLKPDFPNPHSGLADALTALRKNPEEALREASEGFRLGPTIRYTWIVFRKLCFKSAESLHSVLPEVSYWCALHPEEPIAQFALDSIILDAWIAFAKCTSSAEALVLLDAQPDEVKLAFETVRDAFLAHADKDHLHRLAPERRAPVIKLLEKLTATS